MLLIKRSNTLEQQNCSSVIGEHHASLKTVKKLTAPQLQRLRPAHKSLAGVCADKKLPVKGSRCIGLSIKRMPQLFNITQKG